MDRRLFLRSTLAAAAVGVVGCSERSGKLPGALPSTSPPASGPTEAAPVGVRARVVGEVASGLNVPWGIAFLPDGDALMSERDTGRILRIGPSGVAEVGTVPGVVGQGPDGGEGGLLGLALSPQWRTDGWLYAFATTDSDNRVVRMRYVSGELGGLEVVLEGIALNTYHDGGGLLFGPDGMLYASTGDAGDSANAQDKDSLNGKILRMTPDGGVPGDNPFGNLVWSYGHRNVEGIAFDAEGALWNAEFGSDAYDEVNRIEAGANYGWPEVEGTDGAGGFADPLTQWPTDECSPSGIVIVRDTAWVGALQGQCLFAIPLQGPDRGTPVAFFSGEYGRIRRVAAAPDGSLWVTTSNTDGRGDVRDGDDRILRVHIS